MTVMTAGESEKGRARDQERKGDTFFSSATIMHLFACRKGGVL